MILMRFDRMVPRIAFLSWWLICVVFLAGPKTAYCDDGIVAITSPSKDVTLAFVRPGLVAEVKVKEGELVKAGQLLVQQDDAVEQAQLAQLEAQSQDRTQIEAAEAKLAQKEVDLEKFEEAFGRGSATRLEVENARLEVKIAELSLKLAEFQNEQDERKYAEAKIQVEKMRLKSPIAGRIEKIYIEPGESVDGLGDVVRVVEIDPLWMEVPVPLAQAKTLRPGQVVKVRFPGSDEKLAEGKIIFIATVVDAASDTLTVRVEVANESNRPAGEHVRVIF